MPNFKPKAKKKPVKKKYLREEAFLESPGMSYLLIAFNKIKHLMIIGLNIRPRIKLITLFEGKCFFWYFRCNEKFIVLFCINFSLFLLF